jgi:hypothetical protein
LQPTKHGAWLLIVCCVALTAIFGLTWPCDDDSDPGVSLCPSDRHWSSPDETVSVLPVPSGVRRLVAGPSGWTSPDAPGLLAAVPGGLCLQI